MTHLTIELLLWMLLLFVVGCVLGCFLRKMLAAEPKAAAPAPAASGVKTPQPAAEPLALKPVASPAPSKAAAKPAPAKPAAKLASTKPVAKPAPAKPAAKPASTKPAAKPAPARPAAKSASAKPLRAVEPAATGKAQRPKGLTAARGGKADNLQQISGIGPKLEKTVQGLGFFHFDQIAKWTPDEVQWVDEHLRFKGRIARDKWIAQAKLLATGDMDKFSRLYGGGRTRGSADRTSRRKKRKS